MRRAAWAGIGLLLAGCAGTGTVGPGTYTHRDGAAIALPAAYSVEELSPRTTILTQNGEALDALYLVTGLRAGESLFGTGGPDVPRLPGGAGAAELEYFIRASLAARGRTVTTWQDTDGTGHDVSLRAVDPGGLRYRGAAVIRQDEDGRVDARIFLAPELHYFDALAPDALPLLAGDQGR